jgi:hypothetical protein
MKHNDQPSSVTFQEIFVLTRRQDKASPIKVFFIGCSPSHGAGPTVAVAVDVLPDFALDVVI